MTHPMKPSADFIDKMTQLLMGDCTTRQTVQPMQLDADFVRRTAQKLMGRKTRRSCPYSSGCKKLPYPDVKTSKTSGIIPWNPDYLYLIQPNGDTQKFMRIRDCSNNSTFVPVLSGESVESKKPDLDFVN